MLEIRPMTHADLDQVLAIEIDLFPIDTWSEELFLGELAEVSISVMFQWLFWIQRLLVMPHLDM